MSKRLILILLLVLAAVGGYVVLCGIVLRPMPQALEAMASDMRVTVETEPWLAFFPVDTDPVVGLIVYPGARADPRAYAPAAHTIAAEGYGVVIVPMPFNLAVFDPGAAAEVMEAYPGIKHWAVGGHSIGGAMAADFAYTHPGAAEALILWAPFYWFGSADLSGRNLDVLTVYGTRDGLVSQKSIDRSCSRLPAGARWLAVEGGNHAQFAWYGGQTSDNPATIAHEEQQGVVIAATLRVLADL